ncbi:hypothetical protein Y032_0004g1900 [Ancylostoma ceylanicum]|uniref:Uncharacterized protein n=1 Tax=Ancylostoma ceylanicum TaxID=53326 RepID=A0A016VTV8_9BILA|nr:hypothetical protein Y032_0004g1900 [Ancylostoma ceylanicum]
MICSHFSVVWSTQRVIFHWHLKVREMRTMRTHNSFLTLFFWPFDVVKEDRWSLRRGMKHVMTAKTLRDWFSLFQVMWLLKHSKD